MQIDFMQISLNLLDKRANNKIFHNLADKFMDKRII